MNDDTDWNEELAMFDANAALTETRILWLRLGYMFKDVALGFHDFLDKPENATEAMQWAARAEACLWRATGDADTIDAPAFITELANKDTPA